MVEPLERRRHLATHPIQYRVAAYNDAGMSPWSNTAQFDLIDGDADLDGHVTTNDYFAIDNGFLAGAGGWTNGDFDGDGRVSSNDYFLIDLEFLTRQQHTFSQQPITSAAAAVAEFGWHGYTGE